MLSRKAWAGVVRVGSRRQISPGNKPPVGEIGQNEDGERADRNQSCIFEHDWHTLAVESFSWRSTTYRLCRSSRAGVANGRQTGRFEYRWQRREDLLRIGWPRTSPPTFSCNHNVKTPSRQPLPLDAALDLLIMTASVRIFQAHNRTIPEDQSRARKSDHHRQRTRRLGGRHLCRPSRPETAGVRGRRDRGEPPGRHPAAGPIGPDDRSGKLSRLSRRRSDRPISTAPSPPTDAA